MKTSDIFVFSRMAVKEFVTDMPYLFISVRDPGSSPAEIPSNANQIARVDIECSDIDGERCPNALKSPKLKVFSVDDAKYILQVLKLTAPYISMIIINCEAGISRSAAIAAALTKIMGQSDEKYFGPRSPYCPNIYIYRTIMNTYMDTGIIGD